jgi:hypothetical protein
MPTTAPLVVTGEDAFSETSHIERVILVNLPARGQNPGGLRALRDVECSGLGHAYVSWLVSNFNRGTIPEFRVDTTLGRVHANMATLQAGWGLMRQFHLEHSGRDLGDADFSWVKQSIAEASSHDPITDALRWAAFAHFYGQQVVWFEGDDVMVKVADFVREVQRSGQFVLPGNRTAVGKYLDEHWSAETYVHPQHGQVKRLPGMTARLND